MSVLPVTHPLRLLPTIDLPVLMSWILSLVPDIMNRLDYDRWLIEHDVMAAFPCDSELSLGGTAREVSCHAVNGGIEFCCVGSQRPFEGEWNAMFQDDQRLIVVPNQTLSRDRNIPPQPARFGSAGGPCIDRRSIARNLQSCSS